MRLNYEEKTYESYFNNELNQVSKVYFPFGQVQEGCLGFDSSALSHNSDLWSRIGIPLSLKNNGVELSKIADFMENQLSKEISGLPPMKANLLFQYKRPEYMTTKNASEWKYWNKPYYRYNIYDHQHDMIMQVHNQFKANVLILYAAPAISNVRDLFNHYRNNEIIKNSNFTKACDLLGHKKNTYISSGNHSCAFSEPAEIENLNLLKILNNITTAIEIEEYRNNKDFIISFAKKIRTILYENEIYSETFKILYDSYLEFTDYQILNSLHLMIHFRNLTGIQWIIQM